MTYDSWLKRYISWLHKLHSVDLLWHQTFQNEKEKVEIWGTISREVEPTLLIYTITIKRTHQPILCTDTINKQEGQWTDIHSSFCFISNSRVTNLAKCLWKLACSSSMPVKTMIIQFLMKWTKYIQYRHTADWLEVSRTKTNGQLPLNFYGT